MRGFRGVVEVVEGQEDVGCEYRPRTTPSEGTTAVKGRSWGRRRRVGEFDDGRVDIVRDLWS